MKDLIFVSLENWDEVWRRNQFVCAELARRNPKAKILFVGLPIDVSNAVRRGQFRRIWQKRTCTIDGFANVIATHPIKLFPDSLGLGRLINQWMFRRHVRRVAKKLEMIRPLLWLNPHSAFHMAEAMDECGTLYDVTDDWISLSQSETLRRRIVEQDAELCRRADAVVVCSQRLLDMKHKLSGRVHLIPNGVEVEHYAAVGNSLGPLPSEAQQWRKPVFGYTGTVHPERVDVELVAALSESIGTGSLVFVGPNHLSRQDVDRLTNRGNVFFAGPVPYQRIAECMRAFDVCMVPHRVSDFTESLNPIKLWEYLAAGKPIVSTDVAGFREYPTLVRIAKSSDQFAAELHAALLEGNLKTADRQQEARQHSWKKRVNEIEQLLSEIGISQVTSIPGEVLV